MLKRIIFAAATLLASVTVSWAQVDINTATEVQLQTVKGIGAARAKQIVDERTKNGPFKNSADLATRVKGIGEKSATKMISNGLSVPGSEAAAAAGAVNLKTVSSRAASKVAPASPAGVAVPAAATVTTSSAAAPIAVKPAAVPATVDPTKVAPTPTVKVPAVPVPPPAAAVPAPAPANK